MTIFLLLSPYIFPSSPPLRLESSAYRAPLEPRSSASRGYVESRRVVSTNETDGQLPKLATGRPALFVPRANGVCM